MSSTTVKIVNLTPHVINIVDKDGSLLQTFPPEKVSARCVEIRMPHGHVNDTVPLTLVKFGEVDGLPPQEKDTLYIVSMLIAQTLPNRGDLVFPGSLLRDAAGNIVGTTSLSRFKFAI